MAEESSAAAGEKSRHLEMGDGRASRFHLYRRCMIFSGLLKVSVSQATHPEQCSRSGAPFALRGSAVTQYFIGYWNAVFYGG